MDNRLNDLNGSEWLYWTNSLYETNYPVDQTHRLRKSHGAMKPPQLMADIIRFFTKKGELILDPFAGVGGTLLGAALVGRKAIGIEINEQWIGIYQKIITDFWESDGLLIKKDEGLGARSIESELIRGDCLRIMKQWPDCYFAAIITDPPYGCLHQQSGFKKETNFSMNSDIGGDFGNCFTYHDYLEKIKLFGKEAFRILQPGRYLVLIIGDRYHQGEYLPLGTLVAQKLREVGFKWKGIRIWWNKATQRPLKPYALKSCFVPNINHQNIIIMRKDAEICK